MDNLRREWSIYKIRELLYKYLKIFIPMIKKFFEFRNSLIAFNELNKNSIYHNKHKDNICFIIGNGVSITKLETEIINKYHAFACNEIFYHKDFDKLKIDYYTIAEPFFGNIFGSRYKKQTFDLYKEVSFHFNNKSTKLFFHITLKKFFKKNRLFNLNNPNYFNGKFTSNNKKTAISLDRSISFSQGALSFMISSAKYMGFSKVILLGCGFTYSPRMEFHFYARPIFQKENDVQKEISDFAKTKNLNIFSIDDEGEFIIPIFTSEYLQDQTYQLYQRLNALAESGKFEIINVHPDGFSSPIFSGCTWSELMTNHLNKV